MTKMYKPVKINRLRYLNNGLQISVGIAIQLEHFFLCNKNLVYICTVVPYITIISVSAILNLTVLGILLKAYTIY